jgi:hypothetical protein
MLLMLLELILAAVSASPPTPSPPAQDFSRSYGVWVSVDKGECIYWLTDVGLDAQQLTETLSENYQAQLGIEILTSRDTPKRCVTEARQAASRAGFTLIRARAGTDKDRLHGIP